MIIIVIIVLIVVVIPHLQALVGDKWGQNEWVAARVMNFDSLGKKVLVRNIYQLSYILTDAYPKVPLSKSVKIAVNPLVLTPFVPF